MEEERERNTRSKGGQEGEPRREEVRQGGYVWDGHELLWRRISEDELDRLIRHLVEIP